MERGRASITAYSAARYRAEHQILEGGSIFEDPLALPILGGIGVGRAGTVDDDPRRRGMRLFIAARTAFAEEALAAAYRNGTRQLVVLGAGLDTFAYRNPYPDLRVVEVDHPDTQSWKRARLAAAGIDIPGTLTYVGVDFETQTLAGRLVVGERTFFVWLGVVPYLTREGFDQTIGFIAGVRHAEVVFDYAMPPDSMSATRRADLEARATRVASVGEPWRTFFTPPGIDADLRAMGFTRLEDLGPAELAARYFGRPDVPSDTPGGHVIRAARG